MFTPIKLDKMRNFRYDMKALAQIERTMKKPLSKIDFNALMIDEAMVVLWAGLSHEDKTLTPDGLLDIINDHKIKLVKVVEVMLTALDDAFGDEESENEENPTQATPE